MTRMALCGIAMCQFHSGRDDGPDAKLWPLHSTANALCQRDGRFRLADSMTGDEHQRKPPRAQEYV